jgi:hypothetical protein
MSELLQYLSGSPVRDFDLCTEAIDETCENLERSFSQGTEEEHEDARNPMTKDRASERGLLCRHDHPSQSRQKSKQVNQIPNQSKELESAQEEMELSFDEQIWKAEDQHGRSGMKTEKQGNNPANVPLLISMQAS